MRWSMIEQSADAPPARSGMMNKEEKIQEVLDQIRPAIHADGGDVEFVGYDEAEGVVHVRLMGACESCPISMLTLKEGIERRIRSTLPEVTEVLAV
jgi:Fe-S cluster biogenesis protein NfuA